MGRIRKSYSPSFKAKVVLQMLREEKTIAELSAEHGVHSTMLHRWRREFLDNVPQVFARGDSWASEKAQYEARIEALYTEIGRLSTQISWLKKKGIDVDPE